MVPTLGACSHNLPHLLVQTVPCSPTILLNVSPIACVLSPSSPSAPPCQGNHQHCWKHGRTPPSSCFLYLGPQHSSEDRCSSIKASSSALKHSTLSVALPNKYLLCWYKMRHFRAYKLTDYGQIFLQIRKQILNTRATLQPNFRYPPPNAKALQSHSMKQLAYFWKKV